METRGKPERNVFSITLAVTLLAVMVTPSGVLADENAIAPDAAAQLDRRGSLTLRDTSLADALFTISETWNVNLLFSRIVEGQVNGVFRQVSLREVLDSVLLANGYGYRPKGQSLIIMTVDELGDTNAMLQTATVSVPQGRGDDVVEAARLLLSPQGKIQAMPSLSALMVIDYPENLEKVRAFVGTLSPAQAQGPFEGVGPQVLTPVPLAPLNVPATQNRIAYFSPKHTSADSLRESFESFLGPQARVVVVPEENRIVVVDRPEGIEMAHQIFTELDRPRAQVRITALIYDVNVTELERLGVNWTHNARLGSTNQLFDGKFGAAPDPTAGAFTLGTATGAAVAAATSSSTVGAARLTTLNRYLDLSAVVSALDQVDGARLLADPSVTVIDREEASIRIVTEIPIQQLTQTSEGGNIGTTSFREAGVTLTVTPQIGGDGTITMDVAPTFSVLSGFSEGQPIIDSREASTTVRISDGQTLVIGGLRQRSEVETVSGIPKLMKWKKFGKLFRQHETTIQETELVVFLRPEITTPDSLGTERQAAGLCVAQKSLNRLHWPSDMPVVPDCGDPYCPYHHPRPRFVNPAQGYGSAMTHLHHLPHPEPRLSSPIEFSPMDDTNSPANPALVLPPVPAMNQPDAKDRSEQLDPESRWKAFLAPSSPVRPSSATGGISAKPVSHHRVPLDSRDGKPKGAPVTDDQTRAWPEWLESVRTTFRRSQ